MASTVAADGSGPANSLTMTLRTNSRSEAVRPSLPYGARNEPRGARDSNGIEHLVVGLRIEQGAGGVEVARPGRHFGNEEFGVAGAVDVAGAATDARLPCRTAEDRRRAEKKIAEIGQIGFVAVQRLGVEDLVRTGQRVLVQFRAGGQHGLVAIDRKCGDPSGQSRDQECEGDNPETAEFHVFLHLLEGLFLQAEPRGRTPRRADERLRRRPQFWGGSTIVDFVC